MRNLIACLLVGFSVLACNGGGDSGGTGGSGGGVDTPRAAAAAVATVYTYELSGAGVTFSADLHGYEQTGWGGNQINPTYAAVPIVGAQVVTYTLIAESMIASFTLNTGAGVLTITTKKNGVPLRVDTINTNATSISINN
jgi:hypothetical protein